MSLSSSDHLTADVPLPNLGDLFPLRLTPFEHYMLLDDRDTWPMTFVVELRFLGALRPEAVEQAVHAAAVRQPMLRAVVEGANGGPQWVPALNLPTVQWLTDATRTLGQRPARIDLSREPGLRVFAAATSTHSSILLHIHHACCDGQGARQLVVDLLTGYARACGPGQPLPAWSVLDYRALQRRNEFVGGSAPAEAQTSAWEKLRGAFHFHILTPDPVTPVTASRHTSNDILKHAFSQEATERLRQGVRTAGVNVNDAAVAVLFQTLAAWNRRLGGAARRRLRIMMPMDLRDLRDDDLPAANRMSFTFLARKIGECHEGTEFLHGVRVESQYLQRVRIGLDFLGGISLAMKSPRLVASMMRITGCRATAVITNLGDPTKRFRRRFPREGRRPVIGNVLLDQIFGTPPIRPHTHVGLGICLSAGQLCVSMLGDQTALGDRRLELFAEYIERLKRLAA